MFSEFLRDHIFRGGGGLNLQILPVSSPVRQHEWLFLPRRLWNVYEKSHSANPINQRVGTLFANAPSLVPASDGLYLQNIDVEISNVDSFD